MSTKQKPKDKRIKFSGGARVTLAALSMIGFVGGWDLIARLEQNNNSLAGLSGQAEAQNRPPRLAVTPWPTIPPLPDLPPIPTLMPAQTVAQAGDSLQPRQQNNTLAGQANPGPVQMAPIPTLAPLPALAPLPPLPELPLPPPLAPSWAGGGNHSGGS